MDVIVHNAMIRISKKTHAELKKLVIDLKLVDIDTGISKEADMAIQTWVEKRRKELEEKN